MANYKLYCKKAMSSENDLVYLYLYHLPSGRKEPILHSLKMKIPKRFIIFETNSHHSFKRISREITQDYLIKLGFDNVKQLNSYLDEKLQDFIKINGRKDFIEKDNKTLNQWYNIIINSMYNQGTILRYRNVLNLLELYQMSRKGNEMIYLKEVNSDFILGFRNWLLSDPNEGEKRKKNTLNSAIYKLKCLKSVINKCQTLNYYNFHINPFNHIKFKELKFPYDVLTFDELQKLMSAELVEVYRRKKLTKDGVSLWGKPINNEKTIEIKYLTQRYKVKHTLNDVRNYFLFQLFSQGIRVSDLITLKWEHFKEAEKDNLRIVKVMMKTGEVIRILVNHNMSSLLNNYILRYEDKFDKSVIDKILFYKTEIARLNRYLLRKKDKGIKTSYIWWEFVPLEYRKLICNKENIRTEKINNTAFEVYVIDREILDKIKFQIGDVEEFDNDLDYSVEKLNQELEMINIVLSDPNSSKELIELKKRDRLRLERFVKKYFLKLLYIELEIAEKKKNQHHYNLFNEYVEKRHKLIIKLIRSLSKDPITKDDFVFPLLNKNDFKDIGKDDYSRINPHQYKKFQSVRTYYNGLLKIVAEQSDINKNLSSHTARHTYTSLMLELIENVSPYDIMNSLGHKHISTTQTYIKRFSDKNVDRINLLVPDTLGYI